MTLRLAGLLTSLAAAALALSTVEAPARTGGGKGGSVAASFARPGVPIARTPGTRAFAFDRRRGLAGAYWPAGGYYYGGGPYGEPVSEGVVPPSNDVNYTFTYKQDVPWDWAHRFPPNVAPSNRPYVPGCSSEPVTVPGRGGEQTVNVIRCY